MKKSICYISMIACLLFGMTTLAQQEIPRDSIEIKMLLEELKSDREKNIEKEKEDLKSIIESINYKLDKEKISKEKADEFKKTAAERSALNITYINQYAALEEEFVKKYGRYSTDNEIQLTFSTDKFIRYNSPDTPRTYKQRLRTTSGITIGFAYNFMNGEQLDINDFSYPRNNYFSLGLQFKTRLDQNNNFRVTYGIEYQSHGTELNGNRFITQGEQAQIAPLGFEVDKAKFRQDQLVFPLHFEIGGSNKKEYADGRTRYQEYDQFKFGIGGFAGFNMSSRLKLRYEENGGTIREKRIDNFDNEIFVYGLDAYVGFDSWTLFGRMNLNKVFKDNSLDAQYVTFGIRIQ